MMRFDLRIAGGQVLLPGIGVTEIDLLVADGKTVGFCQSSCEVDVREIVRVPGLTVLPGPIDPHVHLSQNIQIPRTADDVTKESAAAAAGGITTFLVYLLSAEPYEQSFEGVVDLMEKTSLIDFGLHFCICTENQLQAVPMYAREFGVPSFKFFMNFRGDEGKRLGLPGNDDGFLYRLLQKATEVGGMICPHAENIELIWIFRERAKALDVLPLRVWYECAPPFVEAEALQRAAYLARVTDTPFFAVHVSSAESLNAVTLQRQNNAQIYIETCPHYLTHDIDSEIGDLGKVNPPLRETRDREALWEALRNGTIDVIGSDHVPRVKATKGGGIWKGAAGFPGTETLLPILISEGHVKRQIPLQRIVATVSTNPAKIFGLFPHKGAVAVGFDADFAIVDLTDRRTIESKDIHSGAGYSIYEGWEVLCRVVHTIVRGRFVKRDGKVQPMEGHGKYYPRHRCGAGKENTHE